MMKPRPGETMKEYMTRLDQRTEKRKPGGKYPVTVPSAQKGTAGQRRAARKQS